MTNTLQSYKSKGDMYAHSLGYLFEEKDWINIKQALILYTNTIIDLEEKLSKQSEQEPVAWCYFCEDALWGFFTDPDECDQDCDNEMPLYAAPVRTKDLTDDEIAAVTGYRKSGATWPVVEEVARAVIAADREKNK